MRKTLLVLILGGLCGLGAHAETGGEASILPDEGKVGIWLYTPSERLEAPHLVIRNRTQNCAVKASEVGETHFWALKITQGEDHSVKAVQIRSADFKGCRIYFGRIKDLSNEKAEPPSFVLLGKVNQVSDSEYEVEYAHSDEKDELKALSVSPGENPRPSSENSRSLVLLPVYGH